MHENELPMQLQLEAVSPLVGSRWKTLEGFIGESLETVMFLTIFKAS